MDALTTFLLSRTFQGEQNLDTGGGRVFSLYASFGLLVTTLRRWRCVSALPQLLLCELYDMRDIPKKSKPSENRKPKGLTLNRKPKGGSAAKGHPHERSLHTKGPYLSR